MAILNSVQIVENDLFRYCSELQKLYPTLKQEIEEHDTIFKSSWYELSNTAFAEYTKYINDGKKGSGYAQDLRFRRVNYNG